MERKLSKYTCSTRQKNQAKINTSNYDNDSFQKFEINLILVIFFDSC